MRSIGTIPPALDAERFSDYLHAQSMPNMVEETAPGEKWLVWVDNDDHLDRAKGELDAFLANPKDSKYAGASKVAEKLRQQDTTKQEKWRKRFVDVRTSWGTGRQWKIPVTIALLAISILVGLGTKGGSQLEPVANYLWFGHQSDASYAAWVNQQSGADSADGKQLTSRFFRERGLDDIRSGQVWRLFTPMFIHMNILHLLFNMFWLRDLGGMIETSRGSWFILAFVLAVALLSNAGQYLWPPHSTFFGGMSGVNYGLFGYIWMKQKFEPHQGMGLSQQTVVIMIVWLFACMTGLIGNVANAAHVVGLVAGIIAGYAPTGWRRLKRQVQR